MWNKWIFCFPAQQRLLLKLPGHSAALRYSPPQLGTQRWCSHISMNINKCFRLPLHLANYIQNLFFSIFGSEPFAVLTSLSPNQLKPENALHAASLAFISSSLSFHLLSFPIFCWPLITHLSLLFGIFPRLSEIYIFKICPCLLLLLIIDMSKNTSQIMPFAFHIMVSYDKFYCPYSVGLSLFLFIEPYNVFYPHGLVICNKRISPSLLQSPLLLLRLTWLCRRTVYT